MTSSGIAAVETRPLVPSGLLGVASLNASETVFIAALISAFVVAVWPVLYVLVYLR